MKKIVYAVLATISGLVLLFSYRTSHIDAIQPVAADTASTSSSSSGSSGSSGSTGSETDNGTQTGSGAQTDAGSSDSSDPGAGSSTGLSDGTYTGSSANTRFGPVQVQITVSGGQITDVQVPEYPSGNPRDRQINQRALPVLVAETTAAQSSDIDMVSGATYTSQGYLQSLQSAIDQARA
ncbi:FMN-binding protein [Microbacterium sp. PRC9]|uniref:FMN-binding protein n=1 Tax=Microbacterium sp. PRC9 TaxID=2962591 RepID=UPI0028822B39|nr:FMN-binding protein [Microbacterium sp. PRC9]MDT0141720.1 FMN-binding protein [Microbacterium sp. PRC9]